MSLQLEGVFPALVTPMLSAGELDLPGLGALTERALADGAAGVLVAGTTGEGPLLAPSDRRALTVTAKATGSPVLACASGATLADVQADVARLHGAGADAVLVLAPSFIPLRTEELVAAHTTVADGADGPTLLYHIPHYTGASLTPEAVTELATLPGVVGLKDSSDDADRRARFVAATSRDFAVFTGHTPSLLRALRDGVSGSITAIANLRPERVVALSAAVGDDPDRAERLQASLRVCEDELKGVGRGLSAALKAALQLEGRLAERWCAPPLQSVTGDQLDAVRTALLR